jgi:tetratricopeptide (TPR) repeat protein
MNRKQRRMLAKSAPPQAVSTNIREMFSEGLRQHQAGRIAEAERLYRQVLTINSHHADSLHMLGVIAYQAERHDIAIKLIRQAIGINGSVASYHSNLGNALKDSGQLDEAIAAFRTAIKLKPDFANAHYNLGNALKDLGRLDEAIAACNTAIEINPSFAEAYCILGVALQEQGRFDEALAAYTTTLDLKPSFAEAHNNLGMLLLMKGHFEAGWREYEWRWQTKKSLSAKRTFRQPLWQGEDLSGKTILLHGEQGLGDVLQFIRYAPLVTARGGQMIIEAYAPLTRLLQTLAGAPQIVTPGAPLPRFDCHLPLMSLPHVMGTAIGTKPDAIPYLHATNTDKSIWRQKLSRLTKRKVGLVWSGNPRPHDQRANVIDSRRSLKLSYLAPVLVTPGIDFISLQIGDAAAQIEELAPALRPLNPSADITDFADTAGLIANLDLVISVDTSTAHLAGALGKPVWILSRFDGCWRWLLDREDSPWYPTARLFRQTTPGDWESVVDRVATSLRKWVIEMGDHPKQSDDVTDEP